MSDDQIVSAKLPIPEAADLATRAAAEGIPADEMMGNYILLGAYGFQHPRVQAFLSRPKQGQSVPNDEE